MRDTNSTEEVFFRIRDVNRFNEDSAFVVIDAGRTDGIFEGSTGYVYLTSVASKSTDRQSSVYVGSASVHLLRDSVSRVSVQFFKKYKQEKILPGDLVVLYVHPVLGASDNIFNYLAQLDIVFYDNSNKPIHSREEILANTDPGFGQRFNKEYTDEIHNFYSDLLKYKDSSFTTSYKKGPFQGLTMQEVFKNTTEYDLYCFFHFVKNYPGKYMGNAWKINETYATWVLNNAPLGEHNRDWLLPIIEQIAPGELENFARKTRFYIKNDTLMQWTARVNELSQSGKKEDAASLCDKLIRVAQLLGDREAEHEFYYTRSFLTDALGNKKQALEEALKAYNSNKTNINYGYQLASLYGKNDQFENCFKTYDDLLKKMPGNVNILGNYGWYKIVAGQVDEAIPYCRAAYFGDSLSIAFAVNYGHTFLLKGNMDSAHYYYTRTLKNFSVPSDYYDGPKTDFELFFKNGWQRKQVAEMADWMEQEFNENYLAITRGNEVWGAARKKYDSNKYPEAVAAWRTYVALFDKLKNPPLADIHNAYLWMAKSFYTIKKYDSAYHCYEKALKIARESLVNQRDAYTTKDNDYLVSDYSRLYSFFTVAGDEKKASGFKILYDAESQKVTELYSRPSLHLIVLSGDGAASVNANEMNASLFYENALPLKRQNDTTGYTRLLKGRSLTREKLIGNLEELRKRSKPEDIFIFYYSGSSLNTSNQTFLNFNEKDTSQGRISLTELMDYIELVYAQKKMIITDQPATSWLSLVSSKYATAGNSSSEIIFLCPGIETPIVEKNVSLFTSQLVSSLHALQQKDQFSAKDLVDHASFTIGRGQYYLPVLSFSYGRDFLLFENKTTDKTSKNAPAFSGSRGTITSSTGKSDADPVSTAGQKNYALLFASDVYQDHGFNKLVNPINDARALAKILKEDFGFDTVLVENPTRDEIEEKLIDYRDNKKYGPNDQLFIFFAGHGVYYDKAKMGFLVANDSRVNDNLYKSYLSYSDLGTLYLKNINCNRIFLVLDACFAGSFFDNNTVRSGPLDVNAGNLEALKRMAANQRFYKGISSGGKQYVEDGKPGQHSPFAGSLMRILVNKALSKNFVTADEIIGEIKSNPPGSTAVCEGNFHYSDPLSHFIFELKNNQKTPDIKVDNLKK